jgi:hypothetical protein
MRPPPMCKLNPRSHKTTRITKIVQSIVTPPLKCCLEHESLRAQFRVEVRPATINSDPSKCRMAELSNCAHSPNGAGGTAQNCSVPACTLFSFYQPGNAGSRGETHRERSGN